MTTQALKPEGRVRYKRTSHTMGFESGTPGLDATHMRNIELEMLGGNDSDAARAFCAITEALTGE